MSLSPGNAMARVDSPATEVVYLSHRRREQREPKETIVKKSQNIKAARRRMNVFSGQNLRPVGSKISGAVKVGK